MKSISSVACCYTFYTCCGKSNEQKRVIFQNSITSEVFSGRPTIFETQRLTIVYHLLHNRYAVNSASMAIARRRTTCFIFFSTITYVFCGIDGKKMFSTDLRLGENMFRAENHETRSYAPTRTFHVYIPIFQSRTKINTYSLRAR